jgi:serine phosphatase RsbU (regulator of sigma subunit)/PAS domain-containing protein
MPSDERSAHLEAQRQAALRRLLASEEGAARLGSAARLAADAVGAPYGQVTLIHEGRVALVVAGPGRTTESRTGAAEDTLCLGAVRRRRALIVPDAAADQRVSDLPSVRAGTVGAYLGVPLIDSSGAALGALCVYDGDPREWSTRELDTLSRLGDHVVAELELHLVSGQLASTATRLALALDAADLGTFSVDPVVGELSGDDRMMAMFGYAPETFAPHLHTLTDRVHPDDRDRVRQDVTEALTSGELTSQFRLVLPGGAIRWIAARARLVSDDGARRLLGTVYDITATRRADAERTAAVRERERAVAERERAVHDAQAATDRLALLGEVTRALVSTLDVDEAMGRLVRLVVPRLADWAAITLLDETGALFHSVGRHSDPALEPHMERFAELHVRVATPESMMRTVARTGEPILRPTLDLDASTGSWEGDELTEILRRMQVASVMVVPLKARSRILGVLAFAGGRDRPPFTEADFETAIELGQRAGLAVDNAMLYGQQRASAELLQRSLLTPLPHAEPLQLAARYLPAAREAAVGGDWHDAAVQPDGGIVLSIGDVMGHDVAAAAAMGQVRTLLRGIAYDSQDTPAGVLRRVDAAMRGLAVDTLATAVVARIDPPCGSASSARRLRWSNAGHLPPMLVRADGSVEELPGDNLLLGFDPATPRADAELLLHPHDTLLLYTDGLVERRDSGLDQGLVRLRQVLHTSAALGLEELCDDVLARLMPQERDDDVALVAVRLHPAPETRPAPETQ